MKKKVSRILFKNNLYYDVMDLKVELECGHITWLWQYKGNPIDTEQTCPKCEKEDPNKLEVLK